MNESKGPGTAVTATGAVGVQVNEATLSFSPYEDDQQIPFPFDLKDSQPALENFKLPKIIWECDEVAIEWECEVEETPQVIRTFTLEELLAAEFPPREMLLAPWLPEKGIAMIYAPRGVGKTHLALGCAYAVASGGTFLKWRAPSPRRVLLIDGEMPVVALQERLDAIVSGADVPVPPGYITLMPYDMFAEGGPDLSTDEGQAALEAHIGDADLIVVDSISTICRGGKENEAESWAKIQAWALAQRRKGRTVLFVHHSGKSGDQRGTSKREDVMDTIIKLARPDDYRAEDGARFIVEFTKNRGFMGPDAESFEATLADGSWNTRALEDTRRAQVLELHAAGLKQREIADKLGISAATVNRTIKRATKLGGRTHADPPIVEPVACST